MKSLILKTLLQARQALKAPQEPVMLIADPNLIGALGVGYFSIIIKKLRQEFPEMSLSLSIPCHHHPSLVFAALDHEVQGIFFEEGHPLWPKITSIGQRHGIWVKPMSEVNYGMADC